MNTTAGSRIFGEDKSHFGMMNKRNSIKLGAGEDQMSVHTQLKLNKREMAEFQINRGLKGAPTPIETLQPKIFGTRHRSLMHSRDSVFNQLTDRTSDEKVS